MTYFESAEGLTITKGRAHHEFKTHGAPFEDFEAFLMDVISDPATTLDDAGNILEVNAQAVLAWLGY